MRPISAGDPFWEKQEAPLDDRAIQQHVRALAVTLNAARRAPLSVCRAEVCRALMDEARRLAEETETLPASLEWLCENGRVAGAFFAALTPGRSQPLPARRDGVPRIQALLTEVVRHSDAPLTPERLTGCIRAFDEVRALEMNELWAVPGALAAVLQQAFAAAAARAVRTQRERIAAIRWVEAGAPLGGGSPLRRGPAFFECALQVMHEQEMEGQRAALEKWLDGRDSPAQRMIALEHERQALDRLRLDHILSTLRMLSALDWNACFCQVSRAEQTLMKDPAGTYSRMDDSSRALVRERVVHLAARCGIGERTFAAAAQVAAENGEGIRREICWWLATDEGTRALLRGMGVKARGVRRIHPDPGARMYRTGVLLLAAALTALLGVRCGWPCLLALPGALAVSAQALARAAGRLRPRRLLRLELKSLPEDCRTMVVMPVLLSSPRQAAEMAFQLETLGCLEGDDMLTFALLGDLPDADRAEMPEDAGILAAAREAVDAANRRAGRADKYMLLTRRREAARGERRFMAPDRKRGALNALMALLTGGENRFVQEEAAALAGRGYAFLITLDAGTKMLPGTAKRLIGTLAHPLNRAKYAVLAPRMDLPAEAVCNRFVRVFGGEGGLDTYPTSVSDLWQDLAGEGCFGGKGIIDIAAFTRAMARAKLPAGRILSHDMLEGLIAGAGFIDDITLFEGHPRRAKAWFDRLHRWTRGDWQLIGFLFRRGFSALDRWKLAANLIRPLVPVGAWLCLMLGFATGQGALIAAGLLPEAAPFLLHPSFRNGAPDRLQMRLSLLPHEAWVMADAVCRTLFRLAISRRHLLEWVTADDAERRGGTLSVWPSRIGALAALALIPCQTALILPLALVAALWLTAPARVAEWEEPAEKSALTGAQRARLMDLAARTWRFFSENTPENGLTPDNVQLDPPRGAAMRTSPTNIGLSMVACVAACALGLITPEERDGRLGRTADTLERLEKWNGQMYNWYDIRTERPLSPRYVSSVDSGNLAASLLLCAQAAGKDALARRLEALAQRMDFTALYDEKRELFAIGMDVENNRMSESHYDLLASESRILSYVAMMLGQVPCAHFARLGRACARVDGGAALISWSGTMFEYMMAGLFLPVWENTLIGRTNRCIIRAQQERRMTDRGEPLPWGVSESGCYAFDLQLNYQYRAFGLSEAALRGERQESVVAPYASILALPYDGERVMENIERMTALGWADEQGFFEAADCDSARIPEGAAYRLVRSHMAHHQGMILAALCNALTDGGLVNLFMARPQAQALALLLQERDTPPVRFAARPEKDARARRTPRNQSRTVRRGEYDAHLMSGGGTLLAVTAQGASFARSREGILINRAQQDAATPPEGFCVHVRADGEDVVLTGDEARPSWRRALRFEPGAAVSSMENGRLKLACVTSVSPEDGAVLQRVAVENLTEAPIDIEVTGCFVVALAREADYEAHPAFQNLFVESEYPAPGVLLFRRRPRSGRERWPQLVHMAQECRAALSWETDLTRLTARGRSLSEAGAPARRLSGTLGRTLQPCSALRLSVCLDAHEKWETGFAAGLVDGAEWQAFCKRHGAVSGTRRAEELAATQARELTRYLALPPNQAGLADRAAVLLMLPLGGAEHRADKVPERDLSARLLWPLGVSGQRPMVSVFCRSVEGVGVAREAVRAHEYYRCMGLFSDLLLINDQSGYSQPVRDQLGALAGGRVGHGIHLIEGASLDNDQRALLHIASALCLEGDVMWRTQVKAALARRTPPAAEPELAESMPVEKQPLAAYNGWGGFAESRYVIENPRTPAPWCNILCNERFGSMVTERGGSFTWYENSRNGRLTPFDNDPMQGTPGERMLIAGEGFVTDPERMAARVTHAQGESVYEGALNGLSWESRVFVDGQWPVKCHRLTLAGGAGVAVKLRVQARVDWIMGVTRRDARFVRTGAGDGFVWARGQIGTAAFMALTGGTVRAAEGRLELDVELGPGETRTLELLLGCGGTAAEIEGLIAAWRAQGGEARRQAVLARWRERLERAQVLTPDEMINAQLNGFLPYQVVCGRLYGRAGWYQAGGAYGFRDQLQDQLSQLLTAPEEAREHILRCAARQFESGDVQHWWHPGLGGVRTRISDDMLFLPYVTGCYVAETGDRSILWEEVPFLKDVAIPEGREDWYGEPEQGESAALHEHCLRAIERAARTGAHGLLLMGAGDWNDGMNRVGVRGRGESVWLTEFMIAVIGRYAVCCTEAENERLKEMSLRLREALEREAWDGRWYLRAFDDEGRPLGGRASQVCRIDSLSQSWAVLAGLDRVRCEQAMDEVSRQLVDQGSGLIRLLTPPFDGAEEDPGYIRGYPPGVRENGGQYTHAACWVVLALAKLGRADEAWAALRMLLPASHGGTAEKESRYRVEPYVMAADVYDGAPHTGRGGWTWYTGAAAWLLRAAWVGLLGVRKRGDRVSMRALLPKEWNEVSVALRAGSALYTLTSSRGCADVLLDGEPCPDGAICLVDDGAQHRALFPARSDEGAEEE